MTFLNEVPRYIGEERANPDYHHGLLPILSGVKNYQVARADRFDTAISDGTTSTYKHAPDIAYYHGKFYVMYLCNPVDEHADAGYSMIVSSEDGEHFGDHKEAFPKYELPECSLTDYKNIEHIFKKGMYAFMHQRRCFYRADNDVMLLLGFYGYSPEKWMVNWDNYGIGRVARRLFPDGSMSDIYFVLPNYQAGWSDELLNFPLFEESEDEEFKSACRQLLNDNLAMQSFAEENGDDNPRIHVKHPDNGTYQAFCYYHIDDEKVVGLWKHSFAAVSVDGGKTFGAVKKSDSLIMSGQKIWGQKMPDGRYSLVYDPTLESTHRWPLCTVFSEDGINFKDMRVVHGDVPPRRYEGFWKDFGPQYVRGIAEGITISQDHPDERYIYVVYSVNKEDIWISHIPVDSIIDGSGYAVYKPYLSDVMFEDDDAFTLVNEEPYDYVKAIRTVPEDERLNLSFLLDLVSPCQDGFYIELIDKRQQVGVQMRITSEGMLQIRTTAWQNVCEFTRGKIELFAAAATDEVRLKVSSIGGDKSAIADKTYKFYADIDTIRGITFRTGPVRRLPDRETDPDNYPDLLYKGKRDKEAVKISNLLVK